MYFITMIDQEPHCHDLPRDDIQASNNIRMADASKRLANLFKHNACPAGLLQQQRYLNQYLNQIMTVQQ